MSKFERELGGVVGGAAAVELADSQSVESVFESLVEATGSEHIDFLPAETSQFSEMTGNVIDLTQEVALPVAVLVGFAALAKEGLRRMQGKNSGV